MRDEVRSGSEHEHDIAAQRRAIRRNVANLPQREVARALTELAISRLTCRCHQSRRPALDVPEHHDVELRQ